MKKIGISVIFTAILLLLAFSASASSFEKNRTYNSSFKDVPEGSWYSQSVKDVYELSLMEGVAEDKFDTESNMSVAQGITIAARLHSIYNDTDIPDVSAGNAWYMKYVSYCKNNGIILEGQFDSYSRPILSFEMVQLFASALPHEFFPKINNITYIQDVHEGMGFFEDAMMFYNAGVLNGNDKYGTFLPMSEITRKRASVLLARTVLPEQRLKYSLANKPEQYTVDEIFSIVEAQTVKDTLDGIVLISTGSYKVTAAEYRYYAFIANNDKTVIEGLIRSSAAKLNVIKEINPTVSYELLGDILSTYYSSRTDSYGTLTYFDALDAQYLSDTFFAKLIAVDELYYHALKTEIETVSGDAVYEYALENDFVCAKQIFISKETPDAYKLALQIYLSLTDGADFDELLSEYNQDTGMNARENGYYFTKGWKNRKIEDAVYELRENEVSSIIETPSGYHIIKRRPVIKDELIASPDYSTIATTAAAEALNKKLTDAQSSITLTYADNFEGLSAILI